MRKLLTIPLLFSLVLLGCKSGSSSTPPSVITNSVSQTFTYCRNLKLDLHGEVSQNQTKPIILYVHGGGWEDGDRKSGFEYQRALQFVSQGYLIASLDYRLAPSFKHPAQIHDVKCAIKFLKKNATELGINKNKFGLFGESAGGHLSALAALTDASNGLEGSELADISTKVQAAAVFYGLYDVVNVEPSLARISVSKTFIDRNSKINGSPVVYIDENDPPFLIIHGKEDKFVDVAQSVKLAIMLKDKGHEPLLVAVENAGHGFVERGGKIEPDNNKINQLLIAFYNEHLK